MIRRGEEKEEENSTWMRGSLNSVTISSVLSRTRGIRRRRENEQRRHCHQSYKGQDREESHKLLARGADYDEALLNEY